MRFASLVLPALFAGALGLVAPRDPTKGPTFIPEWEVETTPGGPRVILNGTVQQVHAKLLEINPNYDNEFAALMNSSSEHGNSTHALETRAKFYWDKINCNGPWSVCERTKIMDGIEYLRNLFGRPRNGGGPGNCGRVSCSWNAAIWWCNDNPDYKTLNGWFDIADGALAVVQKCAPAHDKYLAGQAFHQENWNVIVRYDDLAC